MLLTSPAYSPCKQGFSSSMTQILGTIEEVETEPFSSQTTLKPEDRDEVQSPKGTQEEFEAAMQNRPVET